MDFFEYSHSKPKMVCQGRCGAKLPSAPEFLEDIDVVDELSLTQDEKTCSICQENFGELLQFLDLPTSEREKLLVFDILPFRKLKDLGSDEPVRLPCTHIIGSCCLQRWLEDKGNSCPLCRRELCVRETEWCLYAEFDRRCEMLMHTNLRELLIHPVPDPTSIKLDRQTITSIKWQLAVRMVQAELRIRRLRPLPVWVWEMELTTSDEASYILFLDEYWRRNYWYSNTNYDDARAAMESTVMVQAYSLLCESLCGMVSRGYTSAMPDGLLGQLLQHLSIVPMEKKQAIVVYMSVQATIEYELRKAVLVEEFRLRIEKEDGGASDEETGAEGGSRIDEHALMLL